VPTSGPISHLSRESGGRGVKVGIVVRTLGRPDHLSRALADIGAQRFADVSIVVVNDGGVAAQVDDVVSAHAGPSRAVVQVLHLPTTRGRAAAANAGIAALATEYVVLHDDDDYWDPGFLEATTTFLDGHPGHVGVVTRTEIVEERPVGGGRFEVVRRRPFWGKMTSVSLLDALRSNHFVPISFLYRREVHEEIGGYREDLAVVEDWDFNLRLLSRYEVGLIGGSPLAFWTHRADAEGVAPTSMTALSDLHRELDQRVRDEYLRAFVAEFGLGLPLLIARSIEAEFDRRDGRPRGWRRIFAAVRRRLTQ
jgi:glycosyltransferase involved in cell wall biosynthesis